MFCVIQEISLKKPGRKGYPKELVSCYFKMSFNGEDMSHYAYKYSDESFERSICKAYKISIHKNYRENGQLKKKQYTVCTFNYYDIATDCGCIYDYDKKIQKIAKYLNVEIESLYDLIYAKYDPLEEKLRNEFMETDEYKTHSEHERITTLYAAKKIEFKHKYECDSTTYDMIYDVFGNVMDQDRLEQVEADYKARKEYEEKSSSYRENYYSNYKENSYDSGYFNKIQSNHSPENKETLKQFYRILSKQFHPDNNPDNDTSSQMQLLNQLKQQWEI